ncbi:MAG: hypothetical protein ACLUHC_05945 [Clostridia bacterium]
MGFSNLSSCELIGLASSLAIAIGENLSANDVASLAAFTTALGDNLAIIATQKSQNLDNANC